MRRYVSKELRKALNDPWTRDRLIDAWLISKDVELREAQLAVKKAANERAAKRLEELREEYKAKTVVIGEPIGGQQ